MRSRAVPSMHSAPDDDPLEATVVRPRIAFGAATTSRIHACGEGGDADSHGPGPRAASMDGRHEADDGDIASLASWPWPWPRGPNPLLAAAWPVLEVLPLLRGSSPPEDPVALRERLLARVASFEARAEAWGVTAAACHVGRYLLCTLLDEAVARTGWGAAADWTRRGLLVTLHRESFGGETFFALAERAQRDPSRHVDLLELMSVLLALGFQGRYALQPEGSHRLERFRQRLAATWRPWRHAGPDRVPDPVDRASATVPPTAWRRRWIIAGLIVASVTTIAAFELAAREVVRTSAARAIAALDAVVVRPLPTPATPPVDAPTAATSLLARLRPALAREIATGLVEVAEDSDHAVVTLVGDRCYAPGEADMHPLPRALLPRIGQALDGVPGLVLVAGHTDDRPVAPGAAFPTNEALSLARARRVADLLAPSLRDPSRLHVEGFGASRPRVTGGSMDARAANRRVEILLQKAIHGPARD